MPDFDVDGNVVESGTPEGEPVAQPAPLEPGGVRFEQVYGKMKDYEGKYNQFKEFGDPASIKERLTKLEQYEKALEEYRNTASQTPDEKTELDRQLQIKKELYKVMPSLKLLDKIEQLETKLGEYEGRANESRMESVLKDHSAKFTDVLKTNKIDLKSQDKIETYIVSQMTQEQRQEFAEGNFKIAEEIFNNELKDGLFANLRTKSSLPTPPLRNTPGGTPPQGKGKEPMTMKEADDIAWSRLNNSE